MSCYRGIYHVSRALGFVALGAGTLLSFSTGFDGLTMWGHSLGGYTFHWLIWGVRYTASALCIASAILALWATFFDHGVPANLIRHSQLLAGYFGSVALAYLVVNLVRGSAPYAGAVATGCAAGFYVVWGRVLKPQGEAPIERLMAPRLDWISDLPSPLRRLIPY
jgi:hypothetical protein